MIDKITPEERSKNMRKIRSKDTRPEMKVRRLVYSLGYRYRLHPKDLPGRPDLVFKGRRKVIFVNGCFWHQHNDPSCKISRIPKSRPEYWLPKLQRNVERDKDNRAKLAVDGWKTLVIWECQVKNIEEISEEIVFFLDKA